MANNKETISASLDLLWGAEEIAKFIGRSARSTFDMLDKGQLPIAQFIPFHTHTKTSVVQHGDL